MANLIRRDSDRGLSTGATWDPFDVMRQMLDWDPWRETTARSGGSDLFVPQFDVKETKDGYVFKADLPGIDEKDLDISVTGNRLTVSGRREFEEKQEGEQYFAIERRSGTFSRSFTLPDGVDTEHVDADLRDGVLTVHLAKRPEVQPRKISIKGAAERVRGMFENKDAKA